MVQSYPEMILYGAGGHGKVVCDCLVSQGIHLKGVFDDSPEVRSFLDLSVITPYNPNLFYGEKMILSVGSNKIRAELAKSVTHEFGKAIHKTAFLAANVTIGNGAVVMAKSAIQTEAIIGSHTIINTGSIVEHNCVIEDFVHIGPGAVVCADVKIGKGTLIGANATILPGVSIGCRAVVGAGSVVLKDVNDGETIAGNPAKII